MPRHTMTRDPTRPVQNRWPGDPWPGDPVPSLRSTAGRSAITLRYHSLTVIVYNCDDCLCQSPTSCTSSHVLSVWTNVYKWSVAYWPSSFMMVTIVFETRPIFAPSQSVPVNSSLKLSSLSLFYSWRHRHTQTHTIRWFQRKAVITIAIRLRYDYDTTMPRRIRLRRKWSKLRYAFDSTAIRLRYDYDEKLTFIFCSRRIGSRRARCVVLVS